MLILIGCRILTPTLPTEQHVVEVPPVGRSSATWSYNRASPEFPIVKPSRIEEFPRTCHVVLNAILAVMIFCLKSPNPETASFAFILLFLVGINYPSYHPSPEELLRQVQHCVGRRTHRCVRLYTYLDEVQFLIGFTTCFLLPNTPYSSPTRSHSPIVVEVLKKELREIPDFCDLLLTSTFSAIFKVIQAGPESSAWPA